MEQIKVNQFQVTVVNPDCERKSESLGISEERFEVLEHHLHKCFNKRVTIANLDPKGRFDFVDFMQDVTEICENTNEVCMMVHFATEFLNNCFTAH